MSAANEIKLPLNCSHKIRGLGLGDSTILYAVDPQRPGGQKEYAGSVARAIPRTIHIPQAEFPEVRTIESGLKKTKGPAFLSF